MGEVFLKLENIKKSFGGVQALKGVDLEIRKGEILALAGQNGCGKSTLIKVISGVHEQTSGDYYLEGKKVEKLTPIDAIRAGVQVIYQDFAVFPNLTVAENIAMNNSLMTGTKVMNWKKARELAEVQPQTVEAVKTFLADTMKAMNMEVEIEISIDEDGALCADLRGEHMGILIGKRGQTLDSLQYLANRVANKHQDGYVRVKLDTENYRARREETLKHLAKNIAHKVKRNRRPVALEPMNPYERRIIHSALQSDPYVTTHSEGEEPYRKVVITLKR